MDNNCYSKPKTAREDKYNNITRIVIERALAEDAKLITQIPI